MNKEQKERFVSLVKNECSIENARKLKMFIREVSTAKVLEILTKSPELTEETKRWYRWIKETMPDLRSM